MDSTFARSDRSSNTVFIMSVLVQSSHGWVLDARPLIDQGYTRCIRCKDSQKSRVKCCFKRQYFHIVKSHNSVNKSAVVDDGANTDPLQKTDKPPKVIKAAPHDLARGSQR